MLLAWVLIGIALLLALYGPGWWVKRVMARYAEPADRYPITGAEMARRLLDAQGLDHVRVEETEQGDHYDPEARAVRLTPGHYRTGSLAGVTVAAHEVGHAIQDAEQYRPFVWRQRLVHASRRTQQIGAAILFAMPVVAGVLRAPGAAVAMFIGGLLSVGSGVAVHLTTLPTEWDASFGRALPLLNRYGYLYRPDRWHARRLLTAAALTYVAQSLASLLNVWTWFRMLRPG